jgi:hypothetical protein
MLTPAYNRRQAQTRSNMRAALDPARGSAPDSKGPFNGSQRQAEFVLSLVNSTAPAPIDSVAFGKRLGEIIAKAVSAPRK